MRKFYSLFAMLLVLSLAPSASAFDALTSGGFGWITQDGKSSAPAYYFGVGIPIIEKVEAGFSFKNETTMLYSNPSEDEVGGQELTVIRTFQVIDKTLYSQWRETVDTNGVITRVQFLKVYLSTGTGLWQFIRTGSEDSNDEAFGAFLLRGGVDWIGLSLGLGVEIVQVPGPDIIYPHAKFAVSF